MQEASFVVNKTSTIKRMYGSSESLPEALAFSGKPKKCEVDVQMRRTFVLQQAQEYNMFYGFVPVFACKKYLR